MIMPKIMPTISTVIQHISSQVRQFRRSEKHTMGKSSDEKWATSGQGE